MDGQAMIDPLLGAQASPGAEALAEGAFATAPPGVGDVMGSMLTQDFWGGAWQDFLKWMISSGPRILLIAILSFALRKAIRGILKSIRPAIELKDKLLHHAGSEEEGKRVATILQIIGSGASALVWFSTATHVLEEYGIDIGPIIAGAGIVGLAVGFGAQELVRDMIAGFFMLLENQVRTGDIAMVNGQGGLVESVGLRTLVLRDMKGTVHIFQNGKINSLSNMTKEWAAATIEVGIGYGDDVDKAFEVMRAVGEAMREDPEWAEKILEPLEVLGLDSFGESALMLRARIRTQPMEQWAVAREYNKRLKAAFDAAGVTIPFPQRTLRWAKGAMPTGAEASAPEAPEDSQKRA